MNWFAMVMLVIGAAMFGLPLLVAGMDADWSWFYLPVVLVGLILMIGGMVEGTS
jgi:hypothetical protein